VIRRVLAATALLLCLGAPVVTATPAFAQYGGTCGFVLSPTTVELVGQACANWRVPGETSINFDFPCDVIIVR